MISTSSANVSPNLSNVQSVDNTSRRTQEASFVKLPVPAIDFQQQLVRVAQPVDEVTIDATSQVDSGAISTEKSRVELRSDQAPLPKASRPVSQPPVAQAASPFPSIDLSSEPNLDASTSVGPTPVELARSLSNKLNVGRTNADSADQLQLSSEAKVAEVQQKYSANSSVERADDAREEKQQRIEKQSADRQDQVVSEQDGQGGQQAFNRLV